jgi:hypothetical protein
MSFEDLLVEYVGYARRDDPAEIAGFNKVKEQIGEHLVDLAVQTKYGGGAAIERAVPRRGAKGPPVLDKVYELAPGKYLGVSEEGYMILAEAKFNTSELGRSNFNRRFLVETERSAPSGAVGAKMTPAPARKQMEQLDADWVRARIKEIARRESLTAAETESLAELLQTAAREEKLIVLEVRSNILMEAGKLEGVSVEIVDHTSVFQEAYKSGRRVVDAEGKAARMASLDKLYVSRAQIAASEDRTALRNARERLKRAQAAQKKLHSGPTPTTRSEQKSHREKLERVRERVEKAKGDVRAGKKAVNESAQTLAHHREALKRSETLRRAESFRKRQQRLGTEAEPETPKKPPDGGGAPEGESRRAQGAAQPDDGVGNRATTDTKTSTNGVTTDPGVSARSTTDRGLKGAEAADKLASKPAQVAEKGALRKVGQVISGVAKSRLVRSVGRFAIRGSRVLFVAGKFVFRVVSLANPVLDLLSLVGAVDALVAWLEREKREERAEWKRIAKFLSSPLQVVELPPYKIPYAYGMRETTSRLAQAALASAGSGNFVDWFHKWVTQEGWSGFVYATVTLSLNRQSIADHEEDPHSVTYYPFGLVTVFPTHEPLPNAKRPSTSAAGGAEIWVGSTDARNWRTFGRQPPSLSPEYEASVAISEVWVRYTYPNPILTPFDFILAKANSLLAEIVAFISKFDGFVLRDMDVRSEIIPGVAYQNWFEEFEFREPLYGPYLHWCMTHILVAVDLLAKHTPEPGDERLPNPGFNYNTGYYRRLEILRQLASPGARPPPSHDGSHRRHALPMPLFRQVGLFLSQSLRDEHPRHLVTPRDPDLDDLDVAELSRLACEIDEDIKLVYAACRAPKTALEFNYEGRVV